MTDEQLLRAAAKAAGIDLAWSSVEDQSPRNREGWNVWNPLTDDGDALRLAVKRGLAIGSSAFTSIHVGRGNACFAAENTQPDPYAATRRAITRAAAELGAEHFGAEGK